MLDNLIAYTAAFTRFAEKRLELAQEMKTVIDAVSDLSALMDRDIQRFFKHVSSI